MSSIPKSLQCKQDRRQDNSSGKADVGINNQMTLLGEVDLEEKDSWKARAGECSEHGGNQDRRHEVESGEKQ